MKYMGIWDTLELTCFIKNIKIKGDVVTWGLWVVLKVRIEKGIIHVRYLIC